MTYKHFSAISADFLSDLCGSALCCRRAKSGNCGTDLFYPHSSGFTPHSSAVAGL